MNKLFLATAATVASLTFSSGALAAACGTTAGLDTDDVTLNTISSDECAGVFSGNPANDLDSAFGGNWLYVAKADGSGKTGAGLFDDYKFTLTFLTGDPENTGTFALGVEGPLPETFDFVFALKGSNSHALYFFDDFLITDPSNTGEYIISFVNKGGEFPELSNLRFYVRYGDGGGGDDGGPIPEPGTLALLGGAMFGLWAVRRRKEA